MHNTDHPTTDDLVDRSQEVLHWNYGSRHRPVPPRPPFLDATQVRVRAGCVTVDELGRIAHVRGVRLVPLREAIQPDARVDLMETWPMVALVCGLRGWLTARRRLAWWGDGLVGWWARLRR
jgi:hypothetical protein